MSKRKLTYTINLEKINNEVVSLRQVYDKANKKREITAHFDNDSIPTKVSSWGELFQVLKSDAVMQSILGTDKKNAQLYVVYSISSDHSSPYLLILHAIYVDEHEARKHIDDIRDDSRVYALAEVPVFDNYSDYEED